MLVLELDASKHLDLGDLPKMQWDALLKELHRATTEANGEDAGKSFAELMAGADERVKRAAADRRPSESFATELDLPHGIPAMEAFLKMRPGETSESFSQRLGHWLAESDPEFTKRVAMLIERTNVERALALLAVSLAGYRLAHGIYPEELKVLGPLPQDSFSGKDFLYRRTEKGYEVYSVGLNSKDDDGNGDDIAVKAEK
jgi:broad specificity phosphatase PhoE